MRPLLLRSLAVVCGVWSGVVVWSELTFFSVSPTISLFAVFVDAAKANYDYLAIEVSSRCAQSKVNTDAVGLCRLAYFLLKLAHVFSYTLEAWGLLLPSSIVRNLYFI